MNELGIEWIAAHSPQAKVRIERLFETLQDRLVKEIRLAGIDSLPGVNLYWRADGWTAGNAIGSWDNVDTTGCGGGMGRPGDGISLYPPSPIASSESAPGIRLKAIRDGIQDYEYAQILKNVGQVPFLSSVIQPIASSWTNWSQDPNALEAARLQLGQLLHQLAP